MKFDVSITRPDPLRQPAGPDDALAATDKGLAGLWFDGQRTWPDASDWPDQPDVIPCCAGRCGSWTEYFAGQRTQFDLPLDLQGGTAFQQSVWQALLAHPARADHQLRRAQPGHWQAGRGARRGRGRGPQPAQRHRALPPGAGPTAP
jgi:methylated-DNA-[protein]-cysteine S-methyltransferase